MTDEYNKRTYRISAGKIAVCIAAFATLVAFAAPYEIKISDGQA